MQDLKRAKVQQRIFGLKLKRVEMSHIFFGDDSFVFFKANKVEIRAIKNILHTYGEVLG